jgi:hypothetical protein
MASIPASRADGPIGLYPRMAATGCEVFRDDTLRICAVTRFLETISEASRDGYSLSQGYSVAITAKADPLCSF